MEENIHDDKLDDYVRKSFEDHEENPSSDMWSRVEADLLPPTMVSTPRATYLRFGWQAVAAVIILVLFSTLICEHLYYEEKLRVLSVTPAQEQNVSPQTKHTEEANYSSSQSNQNTQKKAKAPLQESVQKCVAHLNLNIDNQRNSRGVPYFSEHSPLQATNDPASSDLRKTRAPAAELALNKAVNVSKSKLPYSQPIVRVQKEEKDVSSRAKIQQLVEQKAETTTAAGVETSATPLLPSIGIATTTAPGTPKSIELLIIPTQIHLLESPSLIVPVGKLFPIQPVRESSGWYIGVQTSLLAKRERRRTPNARPSRPAFANKQENTSIAAIWWLNTGKKLNARVFLESGIGYQKTVQEATHTPEFRFGDGIHQGIGTRRAFNYDLSTYGGTAEVSLRMEQTDPGTQPPDTEPISLKINTEHRLEMLRIPLLVKYQFGTKRLHANLKTGLLGNIVLKNELDISARVSQNTRFKPVAGSDGYTLQLDQKKFFLGYWLSVGTEFKLNKNLSLLLEPTLVGDFTRKDQYSRRLPQQFLSGLNVGANYYF